MQSSFSASASRGVIESPVSIVLGIKHFLWFCILDLKLKQYFDFLYHVDHSNQGNDAIKYFFTVVLLFM